MVSLRSKSIRLERGIFRVLGMPTCATKTREMLRLDLKKKENYFLETLNYCSSATTEVKMRGKQEQVNKARKYQ